MTEDSLDELGAEYTVEGVHLQARDRSPVDDVLLEGVAASGARRWTAVSVKHAPLLIPSSSDSVKAVRQFLDLALMYPEEMRDGTWRSVLVVADPHRDVRALNRLAQTAAGADDARQFSSRIDASGTDFRRFSGRIHELAHAAARYGTPLPGGSAGVDSLVWRWLASFSVRAVKLEGLSRDDRAHAISSLRRCIDPARAVEAFERIDGCVASWETTSATIRRHTVSREIADVRWPAPSAGSHPELDLDAITTFTALRAQGRIDGPRGFPDLPSPLAEFLAEIDDGSGLTSAMDDTHLWMRKVLGQSEELAHAITRSDLADATTLRSVRCSNTAASACRDLLNAQLSTPRRSAGARAGLQAALVLTTLDRAASALDEFCDALSVDLKVLDRAEGPSQKAAATPLMRQAVEALRSALGARHEIDLLRTTLMVETTGLVVVEGGWGTGKSFHLGRHALARVATERPTVMVLGREMQMPPEEDVLQSAARNYRTNSDPLVTALDRCAADASKSAMLIVDALNEARVRHDDDLRALATLAAQHPRLIVVVSRRDDQEPLPDDLGAAVYRHAGVDPASAWELLRSHLNLPPVTVPWTVPDYRRPLVLRVFARVAQGRPTSQVPRMSELLDEWLTVLAREFASMRAPVEGEGAKALHDRGELRAILEVIDSAATPMTYREIVNAAQLECELASRALDFLLDEGVLAVDDGHAIVYGLDRVRELRRAEHELSRRGIRALDRTVLENRNEPVSPGSEMSAFAAVAPRVLKREVLWRPRSRRRPSGSTIAFARSLQHRPPNLVTARTLAGADALSRVPETAEFLWFAATVNSVVEGHPLGAGYAADKVASWRPRARLARFVEPMWSMLSARRSADRAVLEPVLLWINDHARSGQLTPEHATEVSRYLQTWTALPRSAPTVSAVRVLSTVIAHYPATVLPALITGAHRFADLEVTSNLWAAVLGAMLRDPEPSPLTEAVEEWVHDIPLPRHLPTVDYAHDVLALLRPDRRRPFATLVAEAQPITEVARPMRLLLTDRRDANLFDRWSIGWIVDENGHPAPVGSSAARLVLGVSGRRSLIAARRGATSSASVIRALDQAGGAWVAERVLDSHLAKSQVWSRQAGQHPVPPPDRLPLGPSRTRLYGYVDGSPDLRLCLDDEVTADTPWWVPSALIPTAESEVLSGALDPAAVRVVDHDGHTWWVLDADARSMDHRDGPRPGALLDASGGFGLDDLPDIRLPPASRYHWYLNLRHSVVVCSADGRFDAEVDPEDDDTRSIADPGELLFGARLRTPPSGAPTGRFAAVQAGADGYPHPLDVNHVRTPAPALIGLLGARWTGAGCDFVSSGELVLTRPDPSTRLLLISDAAVQELRGLGYRLVGSLRTVNLRRRSPAIWRQERDDELRARWVLP
jgi:hypothetical protein